VRVHLSTQISCLGRRRTHLYAFQLREVTSCVTLSLHNVAKLSISSATLELAALSQAPSRSAHSGDVQKPSEWSQFSESSRQDSFVQDRPSRFYQSLSISVTVKFIFSKPSNLFVSFSQQLPGIYRIREGLGSNPSLVIFLFQYYGRTSTIST
jgi:hypothetical protein